MTATNRDRARRARRGVARAPAFGGGLLNSADKFLGYAVILLGAAQCLATFRFFERIEEPAAWWFAGGMLLVLTGALTLLRLRYGAVAPGVRRVSVAANVVLGLFWVALYWGLFHKFARNPSSFAGLFVIVAAAAVSLLHTWRARP